MHLAAMHVTNFRRLKDVHIHFDEKTTVFVGSNNSGKTSATHVLDVFLGPRPHFTIHDFNADTWKVFDEIGQNPVAGDLPTITLDLWFRIEATDLHRVISILPSLKWQDSPVGVRLQFAPKDAGELLSNYQTAKVLSDAACTTDGEGGGYHPWPESLTDYLSRKLRDEYRIHYFVLDSQQFDAEGKGQEDDLPRSLDDEQRSGASIIASLIRVDFLDAQRHLSDREAGGRAENLSRRLSKFYERNLDQFDDDFAALSALAGSESLLNEHLKKVFGPTLQQLNQLGYPGFADPHLEIRS
jgi:predicted ATP-dependent endonuclease of OLD family